MGARGKFGLWLVGLTLLGACAESAGNAGSGPEPGIIAAGVPTALLDLAAAAPTSTMYRMTRRYEAHWVVNGVGEELAYREEVFSDGQGRFAIDPLEVLEPDMSPNQEGVFMTLQQLRAGFFFRHRDFGLRNVDRLLRQWKVTDSGITSQILGHTCANLEFERLKDPENIYYVAIDVATGLILRVEERDMTGALLTLLEVESLSLTPNLSGVVFHQSLNLEQELTASSTAKLPFLPSKPKMLPRGYRLNKAVKVLESTTGQTWVRFNYDDGLEELFFMHSGSSTAVAPGANSAGSPGAALPEDVAKYLTIGPWTVLFGEVRDQKFIAMGKVPRDELVDLVDSALAE